MCGNGNKSTEMSSHLPAKRERYRCDVGGCSHAMSRYFEVVDMGFKLFMTSVLALFPAIYTLQIAMCAVVLYMTVHLLVVPYVRKGDDRVHVLCLSELFLIALAGFVINQDGLDAASDLLLSVLLIILSVFFFIVLLIISFRNVVKLLRNSKFCKKLRHRGAANTTGASEKERKRKKKRRSERKNGEDRIDKRSLSNYSIFINR